VEKPVYQSKEVIIDENEYLLDESSNVEVGGESLKIEGRDGDKYVQAALRVNCSMCLARKSESTEEHSEHKIRVICCLSTSKTIR
jgi:hypothetical protein